MIAVETFWSINATQILMLLVMVGAFIVWFSRFEGQVRTATAGLANLAAQTDKTFTDQRQFLDSLTARITQMDREGTRKSQQALAADEKLYEINTKRLDRLETITLDLAPKVAAMVKDVQWIADSVKKNGSVTNK